MSTYHLTTIYTLNFVSFRAYRVTHARTSRSYKRVEQFFRQYTNTNEETGSLSSRRNY
jgi:hypothetical protein